MATHFPINALPSSQFLQSTSRCRQKRRSTSIIVSAAKDVNKGLGVLEWTGAVVPQGLLVKGVKTGWKAAWEVFMRELAPQSRDGTYTRPSYTFQSRIGDPQHPAVPGRYVLYVGNACPWCHRVLLALALRGAAPQDITVVRLTDDPERASRGGWVLDIPDPVFGAKDLRQVYDAASSGYTGRCTAPLLVDATTRRIVCNESSIIVRNLGTVVLPGWHDAQLVPEGTLGEIDALNDDIYNNVNNGVYKAGFATSQAGHNTAAAALFDALARLNTRLESRRFLHGDRVTESDVWLYPTLIRLDAVYAVLFKVAKHRVVDYPNLHRWLVDMYQLPVPGAMQVADTFDLEDARQSYFKQLFPLNPGGIVPYGPTLEDVLLRTGQPASEGALRQG